MSLDVEIAKYLDDQGIGEFDELGAGGVIYIGLLPDVPDEVIAIRPTGGYQADGKLPYDLPTVQILVRSTQDSRLGQQRAQSIYNTLHGLKNVQLVPDGIWIVGCRGIQSAPAHIGRDANGRHEYSLNFEFNVRNDGRI